MKQPSLIILCAVFLFTACTQKTVKINMLPAIARADSAVVMYYHTPGNPRFFNMIRLKENSELSAVIKDVNDRVITAKDTCTTQGKIYFYGKAGAVETVYFSRNRDCMTLSFIRTGEKYFTTMSKETKELLNDLEKKVTILPGRQE